LSTKTEGSSLFTRLEKHGIRPVKSLGQNFLTDRNVINKIVDAAGICSDDLVIEIGPGAGSMTDILADRAGAYVGVEIDRHMIPLLEELLSDHDNTSILNMDFLETDIRKDVLGLYPEFNSYKVVANLPYYITTPIIMKLLESDSPPVKMTVMMQREVADRMRALPGSKDYGSLTVAVGVFCDVEKVMDVSRNCFFPKPDVTSTVLNLLNKGKDILKGNDRDLFFSIVRASFSQRRKKMSNSLVNTSGFSVTREQVEGILTEMGLPPDIRAEKLSLDQFARFTFQMETLLRN